MLKVLTKKLQDIKIAKQNAIVQKIHDEFDSAEDRLLDEADNLLTELNIPTETDIELKAKKLNNLGFVNSETVIKANDLKKIRKAQESLIVKTKEQAELIRYYKKNYPFNKFLTEDELHRICEKYNLVFAPVKNYKKDVPEKNIKEIEGRKLLSSSDLPDTRYVLKIDVNRMEIRKDYDKNLINKLKEGIEVSIEDIYIRTEKEGYYQHEYTSANFIEPVRKYREIIVGINLKESLHRFLNSKFNVDYFTYSDTYKIESVNMEGLFIAAPQDHFDLKGLTKKGKFAFMNVEIFETKPKDPVVFRYVKGGIQVLTKWGIEASDPLLLNEIDN